MRVTLCALAAGLLNASFSFSISLEQAVASGLARELNLFIEEGVWKYKRFCSEDRTYWDRILQENVQEGKREKTQLIEFLESLDPLYLQESLAAPLVRALEEAGMPPEQTLWISSKTQRGYHATPLGKQKVIAALLGELWQSCQPAKSRSREEFSLGVLPIGRATSGRGYLTAPDNAWVPASGRLQTTLHFNVDNYVNLVDEPDGQIMQKYETLTAALDMRHGFELGGVSMEAGLQIEFHRNGQGVLNRLIINTEKVAGRLNESRFEVEQGYLVSHKGRVLESHDGNGYGIGDILVSVKAALFEGHSVSLPDVAMRAAVNFVPDENEFSSGRYAAVGLSFSKILKDWLILHSDFRAMFPFEREDRMGLPLKHSNYGATLGLEFQPWKDTAIHLQVDGNLTPYRDTDLKAFDRHYGGFSLGLSKRFCVGGRRYFFQIYGRENFELFPFRMGHNSDPDFSCGISLGTQF